MNLLATLSLLVVHISLCGAFFNHFGQARLGGRVLAMEDSFYGIQGETDAKGQPVDFSKFKNKIVYGVNVASKCGYTASGYKLLSELAEIEGVEVLLLPCNQFGGQEPGSDTEIEGFCALKGVKGANVLTKADVNGKNTRPTYEFVKQEIKMGNIMWNFAGKFLVDKEGKVLPVKSEKDLKKQIQKML